MSNFDEQAYQVFYEKCTQSLARAWPTAVLCQSHIIYDDAFFVGRYTRGILCGHFEASPLCQHCHLLEINQHPDSLKIVSEQIGGALKIDQIYGAQSFAYQTPLMGSKKVIVVMYPESLTESASNALLKILEEPPESVHFLLYSTKTQRIALTIKTRCQYWKLPEPMVPSDDLLRFLAFFPPNSKEGELFQKHEALLQDIDGLCSKTLELSVFTERWSSFSLLPFLSFMVLMLTQLLKTKLTHDKPCLWMTASMLNLESLTIHSLINATNRLLFRVREGIALNKTLVFEHIGYLFLVGNENAQSHFFDKDVLC